MSTIQVRRDTAANWTAANPTLAQGEIGFEFDTGLIKIGTGTTAWTGLGYFAGSGSGGSVSSVFGRIGTVVAQTGDYTAAQVNALNAPTGGSTYPGGTTEFLRADGTWDVPPGGGSGSVNSVFGRTGIVVAQTGDYTSTQVGALAEPSGGSYPGGTTEFLRADGNWEVPPGTGSGAVSSVFGRTGAVVAATNDYTPTQVGSLTAPVGGSTYPGSTTEFLRADGNWEVPAGGGGPFGSVAYADQVPAYEGSRNWVSSTLGTVKLGVALSWCYTGFRADIPVIGDSVTEGMGASTFAARWANQASIATRTANGVTSGGLGFVGIASTGEDSYTWPFTSTGSPTSIIVGPVLGAQYRTSAGNWTWTAPTGTTSIKIMYADLGSPYTGVFSYKIGSATAVNVTVSAGAGDGRLTADLAITAGTVLTIAWVSGTIIIEGLVHFNGDESAGVTWHACGHFGWQAGESTDSNGWNQTNSVDWRPSIAALVPGAGALGIMLGGNDGQQYSSSQFQTNLQTLITYLRGNATLAALPLIILIEGQANTTFVSAWSAYPAAMRAIAAANNNTQCIDFNYRFPPVATGLTVGGNALYYDAYHPTSMGHAYAGRIAAAAIQIT
jgi:hypothetical protein